MLYLKQTLMSVGPIVFKIQIVVKLIAPSGLRGDNGTTIAQKTVFVGHKSPRDL